MNVLVITIHNPNFSTGPHIRLESFLKATASEAKLASSAEGARAHEPAPITFLLPHFSKKNSKFETLKVLINIQLYIIKNRKNIDLIHMVTPPSYPGLIAVFAKKILRIPYIVDVGDPCAENMATSNDWSHKSLKFKLFKKLDNFTYKHAKHLILTSPILAKYTPYTKEKTTLLTAIEEKSEFLERTLPNNKKCVFTGNFGPLQNLQYIVKVFAEAIKKDLEISLDIIGEGSSESKTQIEEILENQEFPDLKNRINFLPSVPSREIPNLLKSYTLGIVSLDLAQTLDYAVPTKLLTYLGNGLPVFGTGGDAVKSIVHESQEGQMGHIITDYNVERDAKKLIEILSDHTSLQQQSKSATNYAIKNLSFENFGEKMLEIYKKSAKSSKK